MACFLQSCAAKGDPVPGVKASNGDDFSVVFLFEYDSVKIYRFNDAGEWRYFATGDGSFIPQNQARTTTTSNGKTTTTTTKKWSDGAQSVRGEE
jgi:hypothetical protein